MAEELAELPQTKLKSRALLSPPDEYDRVRDMFRSRGTYGRFKDFRAAKGLVEAWYAFEDEREEEALRLWCEEHDLKVVDEK